MRVMLTDFGYTDRELFARLPGTARQRRHGRDVVTVIVLGLILLLIGLVAGVGLLWTVGVVLVLVGAVLWILGATGHQVGRRAHYF